MKKLLYLFTVLTLICCKNGQNRSKHDCNIDSVHVPKDSTNENQKSIHFSDQQLEKFLDSIGKLPALPLMEQVSSSSDSIFKNQQQLSVSITASDFEKLKLSCKSAHIDIKTARSIFGNITIDSAYLKDGIIPVSFISFDKNTNDFEEYAVCLGYIDAGWSCDLYFFLGNKIIAKHNIFHRYGLEIKHYTDTDGKTIVYYKQNFESGSGIWWFNFYFYKYYNNKLIPVLNELQNGNLQYPWSNRVIWLESTIQQTNPLTLKMVYSQSFSDSAEGLKFIDDSTSVQYTWNAASKTLVGNYEKSNISKAQILTYYSNDNDVLFIHAYYELLKRNIKDYRFRKSTLHFLNEVKNQHDGNGL